MRAGGTEGELGEAVVVDPPASVAWRSRMRAAFIVVTIGRNPPCRVGEAGDRAGPVGDGRRG